MSRSLRHTPIVPNANVASEKEDKRQAHQRERKWFSDHISPQTVTAEDFEVEDFRLHPHSGRAIFGKDGKAFLGHRAKYEDPKTLRK
ncbi:MAG: hypothetical protein LCH46_12100 [Proteobacteria bacterium]|nr:hypothetical protein [Pseudomonadota bacterium]